MLSRIQIGLAVIAFLAALLVIQTVRIEGFKLWPVSVKGYKARLAETRTQLEQISTARNEQKQTSAKTVREVIEGQDKVRTVVKVIHDAPNPEECRTPALDVLRNEL